MKLGDSQTQIRRWNLNGVAWGKNTDAEGTVYINLTQSSIAQLWLVDVYSDRDRTEIVATGSSSSSQETIQLIPENNSNLAGSIELNYQADSSDIEIIAIPNLLSWRLRQLRSLWQTRDSAQNSPIIDPDLINLGDLKNPVIGNPAYDLWQSRQTWIGEQLTNLQTAPKTLEGFALIIASTLTLTPQEPVTLDSLIALDTQRQQGNNITDRLTEFSLSLPTFDYLLRIRNLLAQPFPVLDSEWSDVYSILVTVQKRRLFTEWKTE